MHVSYAWKPGMLLSFLPTPRDESGDRNRTFRKEQDGGEREWTADADAADDVRRWERSFAAGLRIPRSLTLPRSEMDKRVKRGQNAVAPSLPCLSLPTAQQPPSPDGRGTRDDISAEEEDGRTDRGRKYEAVKVERAVNNMRSSFLSASQSLGL